MYSILTDDQSVSGSLSNTISSSISSVSNVEITGILPYKLTSDDLGNRITIEFGRKSSRWLYGEADVEVGLAEDKAISYISIEFKRGIDVKDLQVIKKAVKYEEV